MLNIFILVLSAIVITTLALYLSRPILARAGVQDTPTSRSSHSKTTMRGGGVALIVGVLITTSLAAVVGTTPALIQLVALLTVLATGVLGAVEDFKGVSIKARLMMQIIIGLAASLLIYDFNGKMLIGIIGSAIFFATFVNFSNFMDGINGISSFHGFIIGIYYAWMASKSGLEGVSQLSLIVGICFLAFIPWNLSKRGFFLGDSGSYLLGAAFAIVGIILFKNNVHPILLISPLLIYVLDPAFTLLKRILRKEKFYEPHREHIYQNLADLLGSHVYASVTVVLFTILAMITGLVGMSFYANLGLTVFMLVSLSLIYVTFPSVVKVVSKNQIK